MATLPRANSAECPNRTDIHNQNPPRSEPQAPSTTAQNCKTTTGITSARIAHISHTDPKKLNPPPKFDPGKFPELSVDPTEEIYPREVNSEEISRRGMYVPSVRPRPRTWLRDPLLPAVPLSRR